PTRSNVEGDRASRSVQKQSALDKVWVQASGKDTTTRPVKEKTWAQVVTNNRYNPIQEIVAETQAHEEDICSLGLDTTVVNEAHQQSVVPQNVNLGRTHWQNGSTSSGLPGLRLSRQLWPMANRGGRNRFGRIKQLARQAVNREYQRKEITEIHINSSNEQRPVESGGSASSPQVSSTRLFGEGTSKQQQLVVSLLKRNIEKDQTEDVVEISDSESYPPGFEKQKGNGPGVNLGMMIEKECCQLKSREEVDVWVNGVIGSLANQMGISSTAGDQAMKSFFLQLGYAKVKERFNNEPNDDEQEMRNYELCNEELKGNKVLHG
ncbi:hypothetical protein FRX31_029245, partial [Thalictrum thalictroides]